MEDYPRNLAEFERRFATDGSAAIIIARIFKKARRCAGSYILVLDGLVAKIHDHGMKATVEPTQERIQVALARPDFAITVPAIQRARSNPGASKRWVNKS